MTSGRQSLRMAALFAALVLGSATSAQAQAPNGHADNVTALQAANRQPNRIVRDGFATPGDGGTAAYTWSPSNCPISGGDGGSQVQPGGPGCWIADFPASGADARVWGVKPDGATSADAGLAKAVSWCSRVGGTLLLPPGRILLTGTQSINLSNCHIKGQGVINSDNLNLGTTILLTSTTTKPFIVGSNWSVEGVNFYWPNQNNGTTFYPPLFSDSGSSRANNWTIDHVNVINSYDGWVNTPGISWGRCIISNSMLYAVHDLFRLTSIGDYCHLDNSILTPGTWLDVAHNNAAIDAADQVNTVFHVVGNSNTYARGAATALEASNVSLFAWRYMIKSDDYSLVDGRWDANIDGVGTIWDSSAAMHPAGNLLLTSPSCVTGIADFANGALTGSYPAFNLGAGGELMLRSFFCNGLRGDFIDASATTVDLDGVNVWAYGGAGGTTDFYAVKETAAHSQGLFVRNSTFLANGGSPHIHGIYKHVALAVTVIQNNNFGYLNDSLDLTLNDGSPMTITGNRSFSTSGPGSVVTDNGSDPVIWRDNLFDKPPRRGFRTAAPAQP